MSDSSNKVSNDADEQALRTGLKSGGLSPEALQRIRRATEAEWRAGTQAPPQRHWLARKRSVAAAASVVFLAVGTALGVYLTNNQAASGALLGSVVRVESPGVDLKQVLRADVPVPEGADLRVFATLEVRGDALVALAGGGNLRAARGTSFDIPEVNTVRLERGELYVDIPPGARGAEKFVVITPAGEFRHLGTQFAVAIVGQQTRLRVREGSVLWRAAGHDNTVDAGTEIIADTREVSRRSMPTTGREWAWAESMAPDFEIEARPLQEFLAWFSRETGRKLVVTDDTARKQIATILMHGNVRGLTAIEALSAVMAATSLHYELPEGVIRVSSARDFRPPN